MSSSSSSSVTRLNNTSLFTHTCQPRLRLPSSSLRAVVVKCRGSGGNGLMCVSLKEGKSRGLCGLEFVVVEQKRKRKRRNVLALRGRSGFSGVVRSGGDSSEVLPVDNDLLIAEPTPVVVDNSSRKSHYQNVKNELIALSLPAIAGQAVEPFAQLLETAFIGRLGPLELASAGVSISIFNIISKLFNIPLLSVATSFVAEDISKSAIKLSGQDGGLHEDSTNGKPVGEMDERKQLPSVSTALVLAAGIGLFEALALYFGSGLFLNAMGLSTASSMRAPAQRFLSLRALGAPANVLSLALQGIFRGFKDTKTPVLCLGIGNFSSIVLFPLFMYSFGLGVTGAALATVTSQYMVMLLMVWFLNKRAVLLPPKMENLNFGSYMKSGGFLLGRTLAILMTMTLGTSMAAHQGPLAMAAHQICLQVWLAVSLVTDALAASGQALIATSFSEGDYRTVKEITFLLLEIGLLAGVILAVLLGVSFSNLAPLFTQDLEVLNIVGSLVLYVSLSQPINALAFIADGLYYGISDFAYAARSMMVAGAITSAFFLYATPIFGLTGVWMGLTLVMALRVAAGYFRLVSKTGPWWFLHKDFEKTEVLT